MSIKKVTVTELTRYIKFILQNDDKLRYEVAVVGEISNFKVQHGRSHAYFTLKDATSTLDCAMWATYYQRCGYRPENGNKVLAIGKIDVYEPQGRYKLIVTHLEPLGAGDLAAQYEELKNRLEREGFFAKEHKKNLPAYPGRIGIVTAKNGAATQDMIHVAKIRNPKIQLVLCPAKVQGKGAAAEIKAAIEYFNRAKNVDVIVFGRGGGSLEDLWEFNHEELVKAVYESEIPIVSAVGHETDYTLADFAADVRAATPSNAMEIVVPDTRELLAYIKQMAKRLSQAAFHGLRAKEGHLAQMKNSIPLQHPETLLNSRRQYVDSLAEKLFVRTADLQEKKAQRFLLARERLALLDPLRMLQRGFGIVRRKSDDRLVRSVDDVTVGDSLRIQLAGGEIAARVEQND